MECFALGLGVGHVNADGHWLDVYYPKAFCRPDPALVELIADVFDWDGRNLVQAIPSDDLDDLLEALEDSDDGDAASFLKALTPLAGTENHWCSLFWRQTISQAQCRRCTSSCH